MKRGGDDLLRRGIWQKVACDLLDGELVKRQIVIHRADHPVAIPPGIGTSTILFITIRVGIACSIQPVAAPALAVVGARKSSIHHGLVGCR